MVSRVGCVAGATGEAISVLSHEHAAPVHGAGRDGQRLSPLKSRAAIAVVGAKRLVRELAHNLPVLTFGHRATVLQLGGDGAVDVLVGLGAVDDARDGHRCPSSTTW